MNRKIIWVIILMVILAGIVFLIFKEDKSGMPIPAESTLFDPAELKVGDMVAGMTVAEMGPANTKAPLSFNMSYSNSNLPNFKVVFVGDKIISGRYGQVSDVSGGRSLALDEQSEASLPHLKDVGDLFESNRINGVEFYEGDTGLDLGQGGQATIEISEFVILAYPADYGGYSVATKRVIDYKKN